MDNKLTWLEYLNRLPGPPKDKEIAQAADIAASTVSRWRTGQTPHPSHAVAVARAYGKHPFGALSAAGFLSDDEIDEILDGKPIAELVSIDDFSTATLAHELARRVAHMTE